MGNKPAKPPRPAPAVVRALRIAWRPHNRGPVLAAAVAIAALAGLVAAWQRWGEPAAKGPDYTVTPEKLHVTPPPSWIHADIKAEVLQTTALSQLDLRDRKLVEKISRAFAMHPWVAKVRRVEKRYPAQVAVELEYRRPVAAVEVVDRGRPGLLFIDESGVLLPSADFASNQAKDYLRVSAVRSSPAGVGLPWGDPEVAGAAAIAAAWSSRFREASLYRIVATETQGGGATYELRTAGDTRVLWGAAPGRESTSEPAPAQKIEALLQYIADKGPLDRPGGERLIDLRTRISAGGPAQAASQERPERR